MKQSTVTKTKEESKMRQIKIEKIVLSCGATGQDVERSKRLIEMIAKNRKARIVLTGPKRRIPAFGVKPNMQIGTMVTIRGEDKNTILKQLLGGVDNTIKRSQIKENGFSFGIQEYIEIPGIEYQREIGIRGLNITVSFIRPGVRVKRKKIRTGKLPKKQHVSPDEIANFMEEHFGVRIR